MQQAPLERGTLRRQIAVRDRVALRVTSTEPHAQSRILPPRIPSNPTTTTRNSNAVNRRVGDGQCELVRPCEVAGGTLAGRVASWRYVAERSRRGPPSRSARGVQRRWGERRGEPRRAGSWRGRNGSTRRDHQGAGVHYCVRRASGVVVRIERVSRLARVLPSDEHDRAVSIGPR